jgi:hypothetical protein
LAGCDKIKAVISLQGDCMMRILLNIVPLAILVVVLFFSACQQEEKTSPAQNTGVVKASQAYQDNFGTPPQGKAGQAFAFVGYLPLQKTPDKFRALPLFVFSEKEQMRQILERLISGELLQQRANDFYNPFPDDLIITVMPPQGRTSTLSLVTQQSWSSNDQAIGGRALAETTLQFAEIDNVLILLNGEPLTQIPVKGFLHDPQSLVKVEPPKLVMMVGMWEYGADALSEILVEFDRPIKVNSFKLYDKEDHVVDGDYFTSLFQMAVVVHPKKPERYQEAVLLRAEWNVVDELGRSNSGSDILPLQRFDQ